MQLANAIKRIEKAGYTMMDDIDAAALSQYVYATRDGETVSFLHYSGDVRSKGFIYNSDTSCSETYGLTLNQAVRA